MYRNESRDLLGEDGEVLTDEGGNPIRQYMTGKEDKRRLRDDVVALNAEDERVYSVAEAARDPNPAANVYPILTPDQVMELAFGPAEKQLSPTAIRKRRLDSIRGLRLMAEQGYCNIVEADEGYRILPPNGWGAGFVL